MNTGNRNFRDSFSARSGLAAVDLARLDTWIIDLAEQLRGPACEDASGFRIGASRSIAIHRNGCWHDFAADKSGYGALSLLVHLHQDDEQAAFKAAKEWLAGHGGDGRLGRVDEDEDDAEAEAADDAWRTAYVETWWRRADPEIEATPAKAYLKSRNLWPLPAGVDKALRWAPEVRGDEGALVAAVTDGDGKVIAVQMLYLTPTGQKSEAQPVRRTLRGPHDWRSRGAFRIGAPGTPDLVLTEGVEDAISALMAGAKHAHACLGAAALGRAQLPITVEKVIVARDDDPPGSPACAALGRGVARLLCQGRKVAVTPRAGRFAADAKDLNDLLQIDVELARRQLNEAGGLGLFDKVEREALLEEVSRTSADSYENNRKAIAGFLGWRTKALDDDRHRRAERLREEADDPVTNVTGVAPWPDPVSDLGEVLDAAVAQSKRFLIAPDSYHDTMALWSAHTHLVHLEALNVEYTPRLGFQSPSRRCGKSTGLKCSYLMSHNPRMAASITPSSLFRAVDAHKVSLFVDEADNVIKGLNPDLLAIMNAGADRMTAKVMRSEALANGQFNSREFNTFAPIALTSIHRLPDTLQDRTISLPLKRATKGERPERLTVRTRGPLIDIGRRLARWAADLKALPDPDLPADLFNRIEDCWFVLLQIAKTAGGTWPERCRKAALADLARGEADDADGGQNADLLADVWEVFHQQRKVRLYTADLCAALNAMDESPWSAANHGRPVDGYYLRTNLAGFVPADAEKIAPRKWRGPTGQARGYHEKHLADAFERYLGRPLPSSNPKDEVSAGPSQRPAGKQRRAGKEQKPAGTGAGTDDVDASTSPKDQQKQTQTSKEDGWTDGTDTRPPSRARASGDPPEPRPASDNQNGEPVTEFPRGASGRRRKQPKAEV